MDPILSIKNLNVDIPLATGNLHAVRDVSFSVERQETFCLVGESGCGKSITAMSTMALLPKRAIHFANAINFAGIDLQSLSNREMADIRGNRISMIFQEPMTCLNPAYTIGNQLTETLRRHRSVNQSEARERAAFWLDKVGIPTASARLDQYPHQLSGGLRQRVMIAMALMCGPELIIADEPTTALDVTIQAQILQLLSDLQDKLKLSLVLITHDLGVVARVADHIAVMYAGQIVETGTTEEIFSMPLHPYTQGLFRCIPVPGKKQRGSHLGSIPGIVPTLIGEISGCSFANRCPYATNSCSSEDAIMTSITPGRGYRCHLDVETCCGNIEKGL